MKYSDISSLELYDRLLNTSPEFRFWIQSETEIIKKLIQQDTTLLDIGCGWGRIIKEINYLCKESIGIDKDLCEVIKGKSYLENLRKVHIFVCDGCMTTFEPERFDTVIMMGNIFGTLDGVQRKKIISEAMRVTKRTGQVLISAYSTNATDIRVEMYKKAGLAIKSVMGSRIIFDGLWFSEGVSKDELFQTLENLKFNSAYFDIGNIGFVVKLSYKIS